MFDNYSEAIDWLFSNVAMFQNIGAAAYKPGLERVEKLSAVYGNPHLGLKTIHVGGTNGKGSVSSLIASVLMENGFKVGLFTSPHLIDFRERIRINGEKIPEKEVFEFINKFKDLNLECHPSFFEITTIMAFEWFARNKVDIAVIEVGLGGRLDSTNVVLPILSVITNISYDHTQFLGPTLEDIAKEKSGIIKHMCPVVIGRAEGNVRKIFQDKANQEESPIIFASDNSYYTNIIKTPTYNIYEGTRVGEIRNPLTGDYQSENTSTVLAAIDSVPLAITDEAIKKGFENVVKNTGLFGRWTIVNNSPMVICDTGHNIGGWEILGPRLKNIARESKLHMVIGFVNDKDIEAILKQMPSDATYYWTKPSNERGRPADGLKEYAKKLGLEGASYPTVEAAFSAALESATQNETIFVGGSTFVVADFLKAIENSDYLCFKT